MSLTDKQRVWLEEYLQCWNGAKAARRAGYAFPYQSAHDNITNPKIRKQIRQRLSAKKMSADEVVKRLSDQARGSIEDFITIESDGSWHIDLAKAEDRGVLHLISKLWFDQNENVRIELQDQQKALELIGKAHGLFVDRQEITGANGGPIEHKRVDLNDILDALPDDFRRDVLASLDRQIRDRGD